MAGKRSNGEGSIRKLKSGNWQCEMMIGYTDEGKRNVIRFSGRTRSEVLQKMRKYQDMKDKQVQINKNLILAEWADTWYADYKSQVQASTYSGYKYTLSIIKARLGSHKLRELLPIHINRMQDGLIKDGYSLSQIRKCRAMLIQIFDAADNNNLVVQNPAQKAKILRDKDNSLNRPRYEKDAFTSEELQNLQNSLEKNLLGASIRLMLNTGLRVQELLALAPDDIAEDGSTIQVSKAIKMVDGIPTLGPPKSKKSNRLIPVPEVVREYAIYLRTHGGKDLVWSQLGANPYYSVGSFRRRYYTALKNVGGVRKLSPHCCRHTYITRLQEQGVPIELIAQLAGHSEVSTTVGYTHTSAETLANAVAVLNNKIKEE